MMLFGVDLPELKPENAEAIIKTCRDIHQNLVDGCKRNTKVQKQKWDKYWVAAYNCVLERLNNS